jgi:uncharacterized protein (TIGR02246 family)
MKSRYLAVFSIALLAAACAGEASQEGAEAASEAAASEMSESMGDDEAAIEQIRADYVEHYNMHHAPVVAELYDDSATWLSADGSVQEGKAAILASLEEAMGNTPTLSLSSRETMFFGDFAMGFGEYSVQMNPPEGEAMTATGAYMTGFERGADGQWKIIGVITNYNTDPPEGMPAPEMTDSEPPPEEGTMTALTEAYETHFNLGHAEMVADLYTDDATVAFANLPIGEGKAAVVSSLQERFAMGDSPQVDIHDVYTMELEGGYAVDAGWYTISGSDGTVLQEGAYLNLLQQVDGEWKIHWMVSNGNPPAM